MEERMYNIKSRFGLLSELLLMFTILLAGYLIFLVTGSLIYFYVNIPFFFILIAALRETVFISEGGICKKQLIGSTITFRWDFVDIQVFYYKKNQKIQEIRIIAGIEYKEELYKNRFNFKNWLSSSSDILIPGNARDIDEIVCHMKELGVFPEEKRYDWAPTWHRKR